MPIDLELEVWAQWGSSLPRWEMFGSGWTLHFQEGELNAKADCMA
jgi:hypothetical protein